jgi:hypothetical protein
MRIVLGCGHRALWKKSKSKGKMQIANVKAKYAGRILDVAWFSRRGLTFALCVLRFAF